MRTEKSNKLSKELEKLINKDLPLIQEELRVAVDQGDGLHDNQLWQIADEKMRRIINRKKQLEDILRQGVQVIKKNKDIVQRGAKITLRNMDREITVEIVSEDEVNPLEKKISEESPLGESALGKKINDEIEVDVNGKVTTYVITNISY